jgi:opacity protein-like surface antigen
MKRFVLVLTIATCALGLPVVASGQGALEQFSYDSLGFRGVQFEVGALWSNKLNTTAQYSVRVHFGKIAPRIRTMVGLSYFKGALTDAEVSRLEAGILDLVDDPLGDATVDLGTVNWSDFSLAGDFQYLILRQPKRILPYIGAGVSFHIRNGSGDQIEGSIIEDNLDQLQVGLDLTAGADVKLTRTLILNLGLRGVLTGSLNTLTLGVGLGYRVP